MEIWLNNYKSYEAHILLNGFKYGFRLNYSGPSRASVSKNLNSLLQPELAQQKIQKEIDAGRVAGPFTVSPYKKHANLAYLLSSKEKSR
jgi:hypothetical protein